MRVIGTQKAKLSELKANLFVRKELNQEHVLVLAELIEASVEMRDFIEVTKDFVIVDGRHRKDAYELNGVEEVMVKILEFEDEAEMIAYAYKANSGGSLPPNQQDTEHTVMLLLECGETRKHIGELLGLPPSIARKYINSVQSKEERVKLQRAVAAVVNGGLTAARSAEQHRVEIEKLKEALSGHRSKKRKEGIAEIQHGLTRRYKSISLINAAFIKRLLEQLEDGDVTDQQVRAVFGHIEDLQRRSARAVAEWKSRFEANSGAAETEAA